MPPKISLVGGKTSTRPPTVAPSGQIKLVLQTPSAARSQNIDTTTPTPAAIELPSITPAAVPSTTKGSDDTFSPIATSHRGHHNHGASQSHSSLIIAPSSLTATPAVPTSTGGMAMTTASGDNAPLPLIPGSPGEAYRSVHDVNGNGNGSHSGRNSVILPPLSNAPNDASSSVKRNLTRDTSSNGNGISAMVAARAGSTVGLGHHNPSNRAANDTQVTSANGTTAAAGHANGNGNSNSNHDNNSDDSPRDPLNIAVDGTLESYASPQSPPLSAGDISARGTSTFIAIGAGHGHANGHSNGNGTGHVASTAMTAVSSAPNSPNPSAGATANDNGHSNGTSSPRVERSTSSKRGANQSDDERSDCYRRTVNGMAFVSLCIFTAWSCWLFLQYSDAKSGWCDGKSDVQCTLAGRSSYDDAAVCHLRDTSNIHSGCRPITYNILIASAVSFSVTVITFFFHLHWSRAANGARYDDDAERRRKREAIKFMIAVIIGDGLCMATCIYSLIVNYQYMPSSWLAIISIAMSGIHMLTTIRGVCYNPHS